MRRGWAFTTVVLLVGSMLVGTVAVAGASGVAPARVKTGSTWTLNRLGTGCENDTFAGHGRFSSVATDGSGDGGTDKGTKKLTMSWKKGLADGAVFRGQWSKASGAYNGVYSLGNQVVSATLVPYVAGTCLSNSSITADPTTRSVTLGGTGETDNATVYGAGGVSPTGTVAFYLCPGTSPCTVNAATHGGTTLGSVALIGEGSAARAMSAAFVPTVTGTDCFLAVYSGDTSYAAASDSSTADQCFTVSSPKPD